MNHYYAAQLYKETSIKTANPGQLIVLLYEETDKHLTEAINLLTQGNHRVYDQINHHITRAQDIIIELATALNKTHNEEFYENMLNLYLFFNDELVEANFKKDHTKIIPIQKMIRDLLESWKEVVNTKYNNTNGNPKAINIEG